MAEATETDSQIKVIYRNGPTMGNRPEAVIAIDEITHLVDLLWEPSVKRDTRMYGAVIKRFQEHVSIVFPKDKQETFMVPAVQSILRKVRAVAAQRKAGRMAHPSNGGLVRSGATRTGYHEDDDKVRYINRPPRRG